MSCLQGRAARFWASRYTQDWLQVDKKRCVAGSQGPKSFGEHRGAWTSERRPFSSTPKRQLESSFIKPNVSQIPQKSPIVKQNPTMNMNNDQKRLQTRKRLNTSTHAPTFPCCVGWLDRMRRHLQKLSRRSSNSSCRSWSKSSSQMKERLRKATVFQWNARDLQRLPDSRHFVQTYTYSRS